MKNYNISKIIKIVVCVSGAAILFSLAVMLLWNWLIPQLFNGPKVTILQALGIFALAKLLTFGFGGRCHCHNNKKELWRQKFQEKMQHMSAEEKAKFKNKLMGKWFEGCGNDTPS